VELIVDYVQDFIPIKDKLQMTAEKLKIDLKLNNKK